MKISKQELVQEFIRLEQECQNGNNISENMQKMEALMLVMDVKELLEIISSLEEKIGK